MAQRTASTVDPTQIQSPAQIPPPGARFAGLSFQGQVEVYNGTLSGDVDALPATQELLATYPGTGGLGNADAIYNQVSKLYGGIQLPAFQSPQGNSIKSLVFVSGSAQGGYGAFHMEGQSQADFDRIVTDSLTASGNYSASSGLPRALKPLPVKPHLWAPNHEAAKLGLTSPKTAQGRHYLSTALFAAELVESFELLTATADAGATDGEAMSRVIAFKLAPEISLLPGFNAGVTQQWWQDGRPDWVNNNSQNDQSMDGNAAGVMFLFFLNDYLGVPLQAVIAHMPKSSGAPLGQTYVNCLKDFPGIVQTAGKDGFSAFQAMVKLLEGIAQGPKGPLNLPSNGNPFLAMVGSKPGGLFS
ncbi:MAG TPA: hypothetical protein VJ873_00260 [bacterium]|nr:hypothetical protein [bacterium]